ncbi:hypothetical protein J6590_007012 [Homalodisca vitripennis]|nr:hypothetical protein J6590_007012 [Homalodisca vitripennis]
MINTIKHQLYTHDVSHAISLTMFSVVPIPMSRSRPAGQSLPVVVVVVLVVDRVYDHYTPRLGVPPNGNGRALRSNTNGQDIATKRHRSPGGCLYCLVTLTPPRQRAEIPPVSKSLATALAETA